MSDSTASDSPLAVRKPAPADHPLHELLAERWSPRSFADRDVEPDILRSVLEAARWAPSCFNDQPWRFLVARRSEPEAFDRLRSCLVPANETWASKAPVLMLSVASERFAANDMPNRWALHDLGLASMSLTLQAVAHGLGVHQLGGFDAERARASLAIPEGFVPLAVLAVGYPGEPDALPDDLKERELAERVRKPLSEMVFGAGWGMESELTGEA